MKTIAINGLLLICSLSIVLVSGALAAAQTTADLDIRAIAAPEQPEGAIVLSSGPVPLGGGEESWLEFAGQPVVHNVTVGTLTPVLPTSGKATGAAVIVAPGGAYVMLSMRNEGWAVAHWLADHGIVAFVLKYRLDPTPKDPTGFRNALVKAMVEAMRGDAAEVETLKPQAFAVADAEAAMRLVRARAGEWGVDPHRVGFMGFSAGAMTALGLVTEGKADAQPNFVVPVYPPMTAIDTPSDAPPMFAVIASDDPLFAGKGFGLIESWQNAKRPVEFHLYERGSHGFGMGAPGTTTMHWLDNLEWWLDTRGLLRPAQAR